MFKNVYKILLPILFIILMGCSSTPATPVYNNSSNHYIQAMNLPADYPTKYLPDGNMWNDFKNNLQLPVDTSNPYIKAQIKWYQNHQSFLNNSIQRGAPFLYYAFQQTKKLNLPAELALIPIGESGFIPSNKSNKGAVGLWQFMPNTATEFNLKVNKYYDGRRDPIASTDAALKYFTYLHYYFDNDWLLAIAAYDTGPGNVQKAQFRNQRQNLTTKDFWSLNLHSETREYIPKLLAIAAIIKNPKKYGVYLTPVNDSLYFEQVNVGHQINLTNVAKLSDSNSSIIKYLNPALLQGITPPTGPHVVLVPKSKSSIFKKRIGSSNPFSIKSEETTTSTTIQSQAATDNTVANIDEKTNNATAAKDETPVSTPISKYLKYKVKKKETLRSIAKKYDTSQATLRKINKLHNTAIKTGAILLVPNPDKNETKVNDNTYEEKANIENSSEKIVPPETKKTEATTSTDSQTETNISVSTPKKQTTNNNSGIKAFSYQVNATDTIYSISRKFNTSPEAIQKINHLANNKIKPGQVLKIQGNSATTGNASKSNNKKTSISHKITSKYNFKKKNHKSSK